MVAGDLDISTGNLAVVQDLAYSVAQKLTNRFRLFQGEWFIDSRIGVPYYSIVLVKNPDLISIGQLFKRVCLQTPGVDSVLEMNLDFISSTRNLICSIKVQLTNGAILQGGPGVPFIVILDGKGQG